VELIPRDLSIRERGFQMARQAGGRAPVRALFGLCAIAFGLASAGCGGVREDRTIEFSANAGSVGFQHGEEGVFVASEDGSGLERVYEPGGAVLATSTPLWSPVDRRLIFTTARSVDENAAASLEQLSRLRGVTAGAAGENDPAGNVVVGVPIVYTCWLRGEA